LIAGLTGRRFGEMLENKMADKTIWLAPSFGNPLKDERY